MKILFILLLSLSFTAIAGEIGYKECASWDTFCKSPKQIVATKCRLGVPVSAKECNALGIRQLLPYWGTQKGLPVTYLENRKSIQSQYENK